MSKSETELQAELQARETEGVFARALPYEPATIDDKDRSVEVVWSAGAQVMRRDWMSGEQFLEELRIAPEAIRLDRLNGGAPLLDTHGTYSLEDQIGAVVPGSVRIEGGRGIARVKFSAREAVDWIWNDVKAGIFRSVSVGYRVHKWEIDRSGPVMVKRAIDWEPFEISVVPIPADREATVRGDAGTEDGTTRATARQPEVIDMTTKQTAAGGTAEITEQQRAADAAAGTATTTATPVADAAELAAQRAAGAKAERDRQKEIRAMVKASGGKLNDAFAERHIDAGTAIDEVRRLAFVDMAAQTEQAGDVRTAGSGRIEVRDTVADRYPLIESAILHRMDRRNALIEGARDFRGMKLLQIGAELMEARGVKMRGLGVMEQAGAILGLDGRAGGYMGTTDLANIMGNVMNKRLRMRYEQTARTFTGWAKESSNPDFKTIQRVQLSDAPSLLAIKPSGEYETGVFQDGKETYALATYGRKVAFNRAALINDDLRALDDTLNAMGKAASDLESDIVYGVLIANAAMADTIALFHADHGNLAGAGAISGTTLGAGRAAMRVQKGLDKKDANGNVIEAGRLINVVPAYLLVPAALEQLAYQYTSAQFVPAKASDTNEFRAGGRTALEPVVEPRLDADSATKWYLSASPQQIDTVEYCYLEGNEGVYTESRIGFDVDGIEMKVRHDFAAKALDHRGLYRNG